GRAGRRELGRRPQPYHPHPPCQPRPTRSAGCRRPPTRRNYPQLASRRRGYRSHACRSRVSPRLPMTISLLAVHHGGGVGGAPVSLLKLLAGLDPAEFYAEAVFTEPGDVVRYAHDLRV